MQKIAKTMSYTLFVDTTKNRLYSSKFGLWNDIGHKGHYMQGVEKAISRLSKGFTILSDLSRLHILSREWSEVMIEVQRIFVDTGCSWKAEISPKTVIAKIQADRISSCSGIQKKGFASKDEAEAWLDSIKSRKMKLL